MTAQARFGVSAQSITVEFSEDDTPGSLLIGRMPPGVYCQSCVVEIEQAFDGGATITVGDMAAQGRFQVVADNTPGVAADYETQPNHAYAVATDLFIFLTGAPTVGRGRVILYLG